MKNVQRNDNQCKKRLQGHEDLIVELEPAAMLDSHGGINQNPTGTLLNQKWSHARQRQKNAHYQARTEKMLSGALQRSHGQDQLDHISEEYVNPNIGLQ